MKCLATYRRRMKLSCLSGAVLAMVAASTFAQVPGPPAATTRPAGGQEMIEFRLPEDLQVKVLVDYVTKRLGLNVLYAESIGSKRVMLYAPERIPKSSLLDLLKSVLRMSGLTIVPADQPGFMQIVADKDLLAVTGPLEQDRQRLANAKATTPITQIFALQHAALGEVEKTIKPFLSAPGGNSFSIPNSRLLIVTDYAGNLRRAAAMIDMLDRPGPKAEIRFIELRHRTAAELAAQVEGLLNRKSGVESPGGQKAPPTWSLSAEPRMNRLVLIAPAGEGTEAMALIEKLDVPLNTQRRSYRFRHVAPQRIEKLARELTDPAELSLRYKSTIDAESGTLFVTASAAVHERIAALAAELDVAPALATQTYHLKYIAPRRLDALMRDYVGGEAQGRYRAVIEEESGMMLVTATPEVHAQLEVFREQLDVPSGAGGAGQGRVRFYKLRNRTAAEVLATIQAMNADSVLVGASSKAPGATKTPEGKPAEGASGAGDTPRTKAEAEPPKVPSYTPSTPAEKATAVAGGTRETPASKDAASPAGAATVRLSDATVTVDTSTNTLIVVASPEVHATYERLIRQLDKRRPQVMIEVVMVALDTSGGYSLGVEMAGGDTKGVNKHLLFSVFGLSEVDATAASLALSPGIGFNGAVIRGDTFSAVVQALATSGRAKVVAAPKILVNDAVAATISSTSQAPYTSVNAYDTVASSSFGGYAAAGTQVSLTPLISEGDHLNLKYSVSLSNFSGEGGGGTPPPRQETSMSSEVVIPDGYAAIVGGLTRENSSDSASKIPLLGDIPGLKYLFGAHDQSESQSTFFVFIRPVILRDDQFEDLKYLSDVERQRAKLPANYPSSEPLLMQ